MEDDKFNEAVERWKELNDQMVKTNQAASELLERMKANQREREHKEFVIMCIGFGIGSLIGGIIYFSLY